MSGRLWTRAEVARRDRLDNACLIIDNAVYEVSAFADEHPGGVEVFASNAGKDASRCFHEVGHSEDAKRWRERFRVGDLVPEEHWPLERAPDAVAAPEPLSLGSLVQVAGPPLALAALAALLYLYLL